MIGNDIVDLHLSRLESNWQRKGWLSKIFTAKEKVIIQNSENQELMVWNLWTRKEAAYKIYVQETGIMGFFPQKIECGFENTNSGSAIIDSKLYHTKTEIAADFIYSIALKNLIDFNYIIEVQSRENINKKNNFPRYFDSRSNNNYPVSISNHGRFERIIMLDPAKVPNLL